MSTEPNRTQLIGYLQEALAPEDMARIEEHLRSSSEWRRALASMRDQVDLGEHSVATIWRRHRLTCPSREKLGTFLMRGLIPDEEDYIKFHVEVVKCRWCAANLEDIKSQEAARDASAEPSNRRRRFFQTSVGILRRSGGPDD